jgi:hypothetical protein
MSDKRVITVVLRIEDQASAKEFWDAYLSQIRQIHGCTVRSIAEGDLIQQINDLEDEEDLLSGFDHSDDMEII